MKPRASGLLLHITSLPSRFGIGDLGPEADAFLDLLAATGQSVWQILPLSPTDTASYDDPYHSIGAFAGNPLLISPELLADRGLLDAKDLRTAPSFPADRVDYPAVTAWKTRVLDRAVAAFLASPPPEFGAFCAREAAWLEDFALFSALKARQGGAPWARWPEGVRLRRKAALATARRTERKALERARALQFLFHRQWDRLKHRANALGVSLFGDMPIYVDLESADVWANPGLFKLGPDMRPLFVSGVPPDYFSATGQLWGTPVYDWDANRATDFAWWLARMNRNLDLFDVLRIDHFRGLVAYWEVGADEPTALNGRWVPGAARELLERLLRSGPNLALVAEDLGFITDDVRAVLRDFNLPGMKILQFAFGPDMHVHPFAPHNIGEDGVVYTGTHDNQPTVGWYDHDASPEDRQRLNDYAQANVTHENVNWTLIGMAMRSRARLAVTPVQDLLGLGSEARMNRPGNLEGNWRWRMPPGAITAGIAGALAALTKETGR
ncbi:MAG: 4-alpha-glucanotransferase [Desulfovibrionaceae bacterium]|jgi:4-alpha-glucanotransferase|nr:4-alpha-glucanotransferase [Desulfovibrionaceae bacterium]